MKIKILIATALIISLQLKGQNFDSTAWNYANTITSKELKKHLNIIASDEYEGRETGKKGQKLTMEYLINEFISYGIDDVEGMNYKQVFPLIEQENEGIDLFINKKKFSHNKDFTVSPSILSKMELKESLIFVDYGIEEEHYNNYENKEVKGKAVFILNGKPQDADKIKNNWTIKNKIELAKKKGAIAVFINSNRLDESLKKFEHFYKKPRTVLANEISNSENEIPVITLTERAMNKILKSTKNKKSTFQLIVDKPTSNMTSENVLAYIPGKDKKEELIVITAHYDHLGKEGKEVFNGADDDGTGTVSLLEIAQAFQMAVKEGHRPKRSILIMPVSGEEKGLLGSKYYADNPVFPLEKTVANLNVDMIGRYDEAHQNDSNYIYLIGSDRLSKELHEVSEKVNQNYMNFNLDYTFNKENDPNRFYYRSDHYNFAKNGVPVIFYFSGVHEDYHKASDTVEKIDFEKTARVAQLIFLTAWEIANRAERLKLDEKN